MCGYFALRKETQALFDVMEKLGIQRNYPVGQYYPRRIAAGHICAVQNADGLIHYENQEAFWWYQVKWQDDKAVADEKITSFNARDLNKPMWRDAARTRRGIVFATEIGESKGKERYLMSSEEGFALGTVYREWENGLRSFAIVTRPPHVRFEKYHDKSTPLFLPLDEHVLQQWLSPEIEYNATIEEILEYPRITTDLTVRQVRTYKNAEALSEGVLLEKDLL